MEDSRRRVVTAGDATARVCALGAALLWGTTGTAQALGPAGTSPATVGAVRIAVGGLGLVGVLAWSGGVGRVAAVLREPGRASALVGAVAVAAYQVCFFAAVDRTGVALGTIVAIGSAPAVTGLLGWVVLRERPERRWLPATLLAVVGVVLLVAPSGSVGVNPLGVLLALLAGSAYAVYTLAAKALLDRDADPDAVMAVLFGLGAVLLAPLLSAGRAGWVTTGHGLALGLYLGLVTVTLSYVLFARGLARLRASTVATLSLAEPLTAGLLGVILLAERPGLQGGVGAALVLAGLLLLAVRPIGLRDGGAAAASVTADRSR